MKRFLFLVMVIFSLATLSAPPVVEGARETGETAKKKTKAKKKAKPAIRTAGRKTGKTVYEASPKKPAKKPPRAAAPAAEGPALVTEVRYWTNPDYTRVSITLDREAKFDKHELPGGEGAESRVYLDITGARIGRGVSDVPIGDGLLRKVRVGQFASETVRVVLDSENVKNYKVFSFSDPFRIIIDVKGERRTEISSLPQELKALPRELEELTPGPPAAQPKPAEPRTVKAPEPPKPLPKAAEPPKPAAPPVEPKPKAEIKAKPDAKRAEAVAKVQQATPLKPQLIRRIVVDPGHGGHDPGAIGASGTKEKDVVLAMGLRLAEKLRDMGIEVVMTRSTDIFIPLQERTAIANKVNADLFVSIHANAAPNRSASGIETYYLNLAKSEKTAQLAATENGTSLEKVSVLQAILFDLLANYKLNDSAHLAEEVQKGLFQKVKGRYSSCNNYGVKQGPFYVLVGATMPSILVETAFISNETEEKRLQDPQYQDLAADGIADGISGYIASLK